MTRSFPLLNSNIAMRINENMPISHISNVIFKDIYNKGAGGAISWYNSGSSYNMIIEEASFINCFSNSHSGAIYFLSGQCILSRVCGRECYSINDNYQFCSIKLTDGIENKNEIHESSICNNVSPSNKLYTIYLCYGKISLKTLNMSQNKCMLYAAAYCKSSFSDMFPYQCSINFSSFSNNTALEYYILDLEEDLSKNIVNHCNIINNVEEVQYDAGILYSNGAINIKNSCLMKNKGKFTVRGSSKVTFDGCTIDFNASSSGGATGNVIIESTVQVSYINIIQCIETVECYAKVDYIKDIEQKIIYDEHYTAANSKRLLSLFTRNNANKRAAIKRETKKVITYTTLISFAPDLYDI